MVRLLGWVSHTQVTQISSLSITLSHCHSSALSVLTLTVTVTASLSQPGSGHSTVRSHSPRHLWPLIGHSDLFPPLIGHTPVTAQLHPAASISPPSSQLCSVSQYGLSLSLSVASSCHNQDPSLPSTFCHRWEHG